MMNGIVSKLPRGAVYWLDTMNWWFFFYTVHFHFGYDGYFNNYDNGSKTRICRCFSRTGRIIRWMGFEILLGWFKFQHRDMVGWKLSPVVFYCWLRSQNATRLSFQPERDPNRASFTSIFAVPGNDLNAPLLFGSVWRVLHDDQLNYSVFSDGYIHHELSTWPLYDYLSSEFIECLSSTAMDWTDTSSWDNQPSLQYRKH